MHKRSLVRTLFIGPLQAIGKTVSALPRLRRPSAITAQSRTNIFHDKFLHVGMGAIIGAPSLCLEPCVRTGRPCYSAHLQRDSSL